MVLPLCNNLMDCSCGSKRRRLSPSPCECSDGGGNPLTLILSSLPVIKSGHSGRTAKFQTLRQPMVQAPGLATRKVPLDKSVVPATAFMAVCQSADIGPYPGVEQYIRTPGKVSGVLALQPLNRSTDIVISAAAAASRKRPYLVDADVLMAVSTDVMPSPTAPRVVMLRRIPALKQLAQHQPTTWPSQAYLSGNGDPKSPYLRTNSALTSSATIASTKTPGQAAGPASLWNYVCGRTSSGSGSIDVVSMDGKQPTATGPMSRGSSQQAPQQPSAAPPASQQPRVTSLAPSFGAAASDAVTQGPRQPAQHSLSSNPPEGQAAGGRLLLRLWPLAKQAQQMQPQTIAIQQQQPHLAFGPGAAPGGSQTVGSETVGSNGGNDVLKGCRSQSPSSSLPALARLERLLEASEAAAAAAKACTLSLTQGSVARTASTDSVMLSAGSDVGGSSRSAAPALPLRVDPQAFFEVDGSLLKGAVLQTACNVIRLAQLGSNLMIVPPWAPAATKELTASAAAVYSSSFSAGTKAGSGSAAAPAGRRRAVSLETVLKLLVAFAGASRALQQAQERSPTEGLSAVLPLTRRGVPYAEMLMEQVERVLTQEPYMDYDDVTRARYGL